MDTRGTSDATVKVLGLRTAVSARGCQAVRLAATLDWNDQANGSYLGAAIVLAPSATDADPEALENFVRIEYIGVPPGQNARLLVREKVAGRTRTLQDEGWPKMNRSGRRIDKRRLTFSRTPTVVEIRDDSTVVARAAGFEAPVLYWYLLVTSHSNYPMREIFFDRIATTRDPDR